MLLLIVAAGPDKGRVYELPDDQEFILGREGGDVRLSDRKSSRRHCRLWSEGGRWYLRDLGSRHGTYCNRQRVDKAQPISDGDHIQVGSSVLVVSRLSPEQAERLEGFDLSAEPLAIRRKRQRVLLIAGGAAAAAMLALGSSPAWMPLLHDRPAGLDPVIGDKLDAITQELARQRQSLDQQTQADQAFAAAQARTGQSVLAGIDGLLGAADRRAEVDESLTSALAANQRLGAKLVDAFDQTSVAHGQLMSELSRRAEADHRVLAELAVANEQSVAHQRRLTLLEHELRHLPKRMSPAVAEALGPALARLRNDPAAAAQLSAIDLAAVGDRNQTRVALTQTANHLRASPDASPVNPDVAELIDADPALQALRLAREASARLDALAQASPNQSLDTDAVADVLRLALAEHAGAQRDALDQAVAQLQAEPLAAEIAAQLQDALVLDTRKATEPLLAEVRGLAQRIDNSPSRDQIVEDIAAVLRHDGKHQRDAVERLMAAVHNAGLTDPSDAWTQTIEVALASDRRKVEALLGEVLREVRGMPDATEFAALRQAIEAQPDRVQAAAEAALAKLESREASDDTAVLLAAIADVKAALPPDLSEPLQAAVVRLSRIESQTRAAAALHGAVVALARAGDGQALARLDQLEADLLALPEGPAPQSAVVDLASELDTALAHDQVVAALRELESQLQTLRQESAASGETGPAAERLADLQRIVEQQRVVAAELVELRGAVDASQTATRQQALDVLRALKRASAGETRNTLEQLLTEVRTRFASREEIRSIVDQALMARDLRGEQAMALSVELGPGGAVEPPAAVTTEPASIETISAAPHPHGQRPAEALTPLQQAYRSAFVSGQTITYVDRRTRDGQHSRELDPAAARHAGHATWRQWYAADLERERQALRDLAESQRRQDRDAGRSLLGLPEVNPSPRR
ncbi:MAG: FHA domain-containing protein [Planctomycetota bacterium]